MAYLFVFRDSVANFKTSFAMPAKPKSGHQYIGVPLIVRNNYITVDNKHSFVTALSPIPHINYLAMVGKSE